MPSTSPGTFCAPTIPSDFAQVLPGAPSSSLQALTSLLFREKRYIAYISGKQLNILLSPTKLIQVITFKEELVSVTSESQTGKLLVAGKKEVYIIEPLTEGWTRIWWEKSLCLRREDVEDEARWLNWGSIGEALVGGSKQLSLFSTLPSSRTGSPAMSPIGGEEVVEERTPLWSKPVASPVQWAVFSPSAGLIATCGARDRLVKIWRRLSFEDGLFDYTYLPHPGALTHLEWRPPSEYVEERRGSGISGRHEEDPEVLYTFANDGALRIWRANGVHDIDILTLHTTIDLVAAIPQSPSLTVKGSSRVNKPPRYNFILAADKFRAAVTAATGRHTSDKINHSLEHLKEMSSNAPDVFVVLDGSGRMSAWGLQSIGHKRRPETPSAKQAFHIAHAEDLSLKLGSNNARFLPWLEDDKFHMLCHSFDSEVSWWNGDVETFFSPSAAGSARLSLASTWSGQQSPITSLTAIEEGNALLSQSADGRKETWRQTDAGRLIRSEAERHLPIPNIENGRPNVSVELSIPHPSTTATNDEISALASTDGTQLVIVDLVEGYIEHDQSFAEPIRHLRCFKISPRHNFLAISFATHVLVFAQGIYGRRETPATWRSVKQLSVAGLGLDVSAVEWLANGSLVLAIGNGMVISENHITAYELDLETQEALGVTRDTKVPMVELHHGLKKPLPMWHPRFLSHLVHFGRAASASSFLHRLGQKLKFWSEGDDLHSVLDVESHELLEDDAPIHARLNEDLVRELTEQLDEKDLPSVSTSEQNRLKHIVFTLAFLAEHAHGLDKNALRYLYSWKVQQLHMAETATLATNAQPKKNAPLPDHLVPQMHWRDIAFAYHSTTQQPLLDILAQHYSPHLSWSIARRLGITAWLADKESLATVFESLAQAAYRATDPSDPTNASLYFLALNKKQTLLGLWRIATANRERTATLNFLKRDFAGSEPARTAARKNAYALLGKRRFEYAAAFFLLADDPGSACDLLAGQCEDVMLAIAVARLFGSRAEDGEVLGKLVEERVLPDVQKRGDRWAMSWCASICGRKEEAVEVLVKPLKGLVEKRDWHQDDPATLMLYRDLRVKSSPHEYQAVLRGAMVLRRMGLWTLALELVRTWSFQPAASQRVIVEEVKNTNGVSHAAAQQKPEPPSMLDEFASAPAPIQDEKSAREAKAAELMKKLKSKKEGQAAPSQPEKKPPPTQFKEPDASSLLDSFGF